MAHLYADLSQPFKITVTCKFSSLVYQLAPCGVLSGWYILLAFLKALITALRVSVRQSKQMTADEAFNQKDVIMNSQNLQAFTRVNKHSLALDAGESIVL